MLIFFYFLVIKICKSKIKIVSVMNRIILFKSVWSLVIKNDKYNGLWIGFILFVVVIFGIFVILFVYDIMIFELNDKFNYIC